MRKHIPIWLLNGKTLSSLYSKVIPKTKQLNKGQFSSTLPLCSQREVDLEQSPYEHLVPYQTPLYIQLQLLPASSPLMSRDTKYTMHGSRNFCRGGGGAGPTARKQL